MTKDQQYEAAKRQWLKDHPKHTAAEYEKAMRQIAWKLKL